MCELPSLPSARPPATPRPQATTYDWGATGAAARLADPCLSFVVKKIPSSKRGYYMTHMPAPMLGVERAGAGRGAGAPPLDRHTILDVVDGYKFQIPDAAYKDIVEALAGLPSAPPPLRIDYLSSTVATATPMPTATSWQESMRDAHSSADRTVRRTVEMPLLDFLVEVANLPRRGAEDWCDFWTDAMELGEQDAALPKTFADHRSSFPKLFRCSTYTLDVSTARVVTILSISSIT